MDTNEKSYDRLLLLLKQKKSYQKFEQKTKVEDVVNKQTDFEVLSEIDRFQKNKMIMQLVETELNQNLALEHELLKAY